MRDRRVARVIDREIAPIWHDRFARLIIRNLPGASDVIALDIHCGVGRTTAELLGRLGSAARVLAIEPDDTLIEFAKTRMRPEWKNRVYLKPGNFDDVTAMADDSYNLVVANLVLGDAGDIGSALTEMIRVNRIGGRILATLPMAGSWLEVEDIFAEVLRDAGLTAAVRRLERLRELRPTGSQLAKVVRDAGVVEDDFVIEQERFQLLFPSGREFLFAPVVEHGPLRLWKAVIGKDGSPQELFWRLKEAIDTYYTGHVLAVNVVAGLMNINVAKGTESPGPRLAARYWRHYPGLDALWGGLATGYVRVSEPSLPFGDGDFDFDLEIDDGERRTGAQKPVTTSVNIIDEDFYDPEPASALAETTTPTRPATRFSPAGRVGGGPAQSMSTLPSAAAQRAAARLKRPPVAEDDFSDLDDHGEPPPEPATDSPADDHVDEPADPTSTFKHSELRDAFAVQHASERDLAAAAKELEHPADDDDGVDEPADPTSTFHPDELRAATQARVEPPEEHGLAAAYAAIDAADEGDDPGPPPASSMRAPISAITEDDDDDETDELDELDEADHIVAPSPPRPSQSFRTPASDSGSTRPSGESSGFIRPSGESSGFTRPSGESSGFTRPSAASAASAASGIRSLHDSGITRPSGESSGFTRPFGESSGFTRPSGESSGFTRPSGESSGFTRPPSEPSASASSSANRRPALGATGSFKVFAPPKPRSSEESGAEDSATVAAEVRNARFMDGPESESASVLADLDDLRDSHTSTPIASFERRAPEPEELDELDELEEVDEAEPLDEVEDEPAPVTRSAPPPPPRAPPPPPSNMFKPRPLLPIVPPKKK